MALQEAHGRTDVMNDPNYLMTLMQRGPHDPMRQAAEQRLQFLMHQRALEATEADRVERERESERAHRVAEGERGIKQTALEESRTAREQQAAQNEADRRNVGLGNLIGHPELISALSDPKTPPAQRALLEQYIKGLGVGPINIPADANAVAVAQAHNAQLKPGEQPVAIPQGRVIGGGTAPTGAGVGAGVGAGAGVGGQPGEVVPSVPNAPPPPLSFGIGSSLERGIQQAVGGEPTSAPYFNPSVGANMVRTSSGREIPVGAPDPSVGALEQAVRTPLVGGGEQLNLPSGGIARSGVAGQTLAAKALREPVFQPSNLAGAAAPTTPGAQTGQPATTTPSTPQVAGGVGTQPTTSGGGPQRELVPADYIAHAIGQVGHAAAQAGSGLHDFFSRTGTLAPNPPPFIAPQGQPTPATPPNQFAPSNLAPQSGPFGHPIPQVSAAAPQSPAQQPPPLAQQQGAFTPPIRPVFL